MKKNLAVIVMLIIASFILVSCKDNYKKLDKNTDGEINIMLYNGDGTTVKNIGQKNYGVADITNRKVGMVYAVAKEFNKTYPNVKINLHAKNGDSWSENETWAQYRANYEQQNNTKIDIWSVTDLSSDTKRGLVSDLSIFENDPLYKEMNPALMGMLNYYGVQAGLPQYFAPWGVFVNKTLADQKNIDVPAPTWTLDEYTKFQNHSKKDEFYGGSDAPRSFIWTGSSSIAQQLAKQGTNGQPYIDLNSDEVRKLIPYITKWAQHTGWDQYVAGGMSNEFMNGNGWWWSNFFTKGQLLTHIGEPWMLGEYSNPETSQLMKDGVDWDYYPRPSTDKVTNTTGIVLDPIAIRNYAMDDKDSKLSDEEYKKLQIAYTFASFWVADTKAMEARQVTKYTDVQNNNAIKSVMDGGFPVTSGKKFDEQMDLWFKLETHAYFRDKTKTPGFHLILDLVKQGKIYDITDKAYPITYDDAGSTKSIIHEWNNITDPKYLTGDAEATSPLITDGQAFTDAVLAKLPEMNKLLNDRFKVAFDEIKDALKKYYNKTDKDFK